MGEAAEQPPHRERFERPAHGDPLAVELQGDGQGHEAQGHRAECREMAQSQSRVDPGWGELAAGGRESHDRNGRQADRQHADPGLSPGGHEGPVHHGEERGRGCGRGEPRRRAPLPDAAARGRNREGQDQEGQGEGRIRGQGHGQIGELEVAVVPREREQRGGDERHRHEAGPVAAQGRDHQQQIGHRQHGEQRPGVVRPLARDQASKQSRDGHEGGDYHSRFVVVRVDRRPGAEGGHEGEGHGQKERQAQVAQQDGPARRFTEEPQLNQDRESERAPHEDLGHS